MWVRDPALGIDWLKILHGEQSFEIHNPIPPEGTVVGTYEIVAVEDKGAGKGAILHQVKKLHDQGFGPVARDRSQRFVHARRWRVRQFWQRFPHHAAAAREPTFVSL